MTAGGHPPLPPELARFLTSIFDRYGYDLRGYAPLPLQRRVRACLMRWHLESLADLEAKMAGDPAFFGEVLDGLTVHVSALFRDPSFYRAFRCRLVPLLRTYARLNIWSCGCAAGEEAYSTAILLAEEGLYERAQIYATDVSPRAVERARSGIYAGEDFSRFAANYAAAGGAFDFTRYFTQAYQRVAVRDFLRRNIVFFQHDLVSDHVFGEIDLISCRNVLIYFGGELRGRSLEKLRESLRPGGFLCLGQSEQLPRRFRSDFIELVPEERIYKQGARP